MSPRLALVLACLCIPPPALADVPMPVDLAIAGSLILAREPDADCTVEPVGDTAVVHRYITVRAGGVAIVDTAAQRAQWLAPGRYRAYCDLSGCAWQREEVPSAITVETSIGGDDYRLADWIMTRQQQYLDSISLDVRLINSTLASLIRSLLGFPRRPAN